MVMLCFVINHSAELFVDQFPKWHVQSLTMRIWLPILLVIVTPVLLTAQLWRQFHHQSGFEEVELPAGLFLGRFDQWII